MSALRLLAVPLLLTIGACAVVPGARPDGAQAPDGFRWFHQAAAAGEGEAALWGPPRGEAQLVLRCEGARGAEIVHLAGRPTSPWRIMAGSARMAADPRFEAGPMGTEIAEVPRGHPLLDALAANGGPLRISTAAGEMTMPADPIVARVATACRG